MAARKKRLDLLLAERGLALSREKAQAMILAGEVMVNQQKALKAGQTVAFDAVIEVAAKPRYVSRGGVKLEGALTAFGIDPTGWICLDVGASTGGFTDCLLQHGASRVYAVDVGHNQVDWRIRQDDRVVIHEGVNARSMESALLPEPVDLIVCDVSFISVLTILPALPPFLKSNGRMVLLVKPQFEVGREQVGKGGIVRDPVLHAEVLWKAEDAVEALGFSIRSTESPIAGAEGNREFFIYAEKEPGNHSSATGGPDREAERRG